MSDNNLVGSIGKILSYGSPILRGQIRMVSRVASHSNLFTVAISMLNAAERECWFGDEPYNGEPEVEGCVRSIDVVMDSFSGRSFELVLVERPVR